MPFIPVQVRPAAGAKRMYSPTSGGTEQYRANYERGLSVRHQAGRELQDILDRDPALAGMLWGFMNATVHVAGRPERDPEVLRKSRLILAEHKVHRCLFSTE